MQANSGCQFGSDKGRGTITTDWGMSAINAGDGNNTLTAMGGDTAVTTGSGADTITTNYGNDTINSGAGNDVISAGWGSDTINAGAGDDTITTGGGNDIVRGGSGTDNFARIVTELCTTHPNVYCEIGYITALFDNDKREIFVANLERARRAAVEGNQPYDLLDKMAYGSDWHMPDMVDNTRKYLDVFLEIMNRDTYKNYLDQFFWKNAYRFLKLPS